MTLSLVLGSEKLSIFAAMYGPGKKATLRRWVKRKVESPAWCGSVGWASFSTPKGCQWILDHWFSHRSFLFSLSLPCTLKIH